MKRHGITEQEYIHVSDGVRVATILDIIKEIVPENSRIITKDEYQTVCEILKKWEIKLSVGKWE